MRIEDLIQMGMLLAASLTIIYTRIQDRKQNQLMMFSEYTRRYQEILLNMPVKVFNGTGALDEQALMYIRLYFDLCSEEFYMWKEGILPNEIWNMWKSGMQITTNSQIYEDAWKELYIHYNDSFREYFTKEVINLKDTTH